MRSKVLMAVLAILVAAAAQSAVAQTAYPNRSITVIAVSYTHLTLPTICSV